MVNNDGTIIVTDENNNQIKVNYIFGFEIPDFNKRYVVYTINPDMNAKTNKVLISEMEYDTYDIKSIPEEEISTVMEYYNYIVDKITSEQ